MNSSVILRDASTGYMPGLAIPSFKSRRDETHWKVRHLNLSALDRETRRDAAADPSIIWDAEARQYRLRRKGDPKPPERVGQYVGPAKASEAPPPPPLATGGNAEPGPGGRKVLARPPSRPALASNSFEVTVFCIGEL